LPVRAGAGCNGFAEPSARAAPLLNPIELCIENVTVAIAPKHKTGSEGMSRGKTVIDMAILDFRQAEQRGSAGSVSGCFVAWISSCRN
jgi:hypothetical protein